MRRFEFVEGSSAKFWSTHMEDQKLIVIYGKIGTAGTRKEKDFPSAEAAYKEYEKKVAEKLREGYKEIEGGTAPTPPLPIAGEEKHEAKKAGTAPIPPRWSTRQVTPEGVAAATHALQRLKDTLGYRRSWFTKREAKRAQQALLRLGGIDLDEHNELKALLDGLLRQSGRGKGKLSILRTLDLLWALDIRRYEQQLTLWKSAEQPLRETLLLSKLAEQFPDFELSFRLGCLLLDRPGRGLSGNEVAWSRRWREVAPHLQKQLSQQGTTLRKFLQTIDTTENPSLAARVARLKEQ